MTNMNLLESLIGKTIMVESERTVSVGEVRDTSAMFMGIIEPYITVGTNPEEREDNVLEVKSFRRRLNDLRPLKSFSGEEGKISFVKDVDGKDDYTNRLVLKTTRFLKRKLLTDPKWSDATIEAIAGKLNKRLWADNIYKFDVIDGDDIVKAYKNSIGGSSCMTHKECGTYTKFYAINPDKVSMLTMMSNFDNSSARCLIWTVDGGEVISDRIYGTNSDIRNEMQKYLDKTYEIRRDWEGYPTKGEDVTLTDGNTYEVTMKYQGHFPYVDTFTYTNYIPDEAGTVVLTNEADGNEFSLTDTGGEHEYNDEGASCEMCGVHVGEDEGHWTEDTDQLLCDSCYENNYSRCDDCGEWFNDNDLTEVDSGDEVCSRCLEDDYSQCSICYSMFKNDDITPTQDDEYACTDCLRDNYTKCDDCDEWVPDGEIKNIDGEDYCENCIDDHIEDDDEIEDDDSEDVEESITKESFMVYV